MRVAPRHARVLHGIVERAAGIVEDFADVDAAGDQVLAGGVDVIHGEDQVRRPDLADVTPLPKMIDVSEGGGVNCIPRKFSFTTSISNRNPSFS